MMILIQAGAVIVSLLAAVYCIVPFWAKVEGITHMGPFPIPEQESNTHMTGVCILGLVATIFWGWSGVTWVAARTLGTTILALIVIHNFPPQQ